MSDDTAGGPLPDTGSDGGLRHGSGDGLDNYVLEVHYGDGEPTTRIPLDGVSADEAELRRRTLLTEIEHALEIEAPLMWSESTDDRPQAGVPIDPTRVTSVDLVEPVPGEA